MTCCGISSHGRAPTAPRCSPIPSPPGPMGRPPAGRYRPRRPAGPERPARARGRREGPVTPAPLVLCGVRRRRSTVGLLRFRALSAELYPETRISSHANNWTAPRREDHLMVHLLVRLPRRVAPLLVGVSLGMTV